MNKKYKLVWLGFGSLTVISGVEPLNLIPLVATFKSTISSPKQSCCTNTFNGNGIDKYECMEDLSEFDIQNDMMQFDIGA